MRCEWDESSIVLACDKGAVPRFPTRASHAEKEILQVKLQVFVLAAARTMRPGSSPTSQTDQQVKPRTMR